MSKAADTCERTNDLTSEYNVMCFKWHQNPNHSKHQGAFLTCLCPPPDGQSQITLPILLLRIHALPPRSHRSCPILTLRTCKNIPTACCTCLLLMHASCSLSAAQAPPLLPIPAEFIMVRREACMPQRAFHDFPCPVPCTSLAGRHRRGSRKSRLS